MRCELLDIRDDEWSEFIQSQPTAVIFHHPAWANLISECYGYCSFVVVERNESGEITAGMPIIEISSPLTGRRWISLPFTDYFSPLSTNSAALESLTDHLVELYKTKQA